MLILLLLSLASLADHDFFEAPAILITLIVVGRWLEAISKGKASESVRKLASMQAASAVWIPNWTVGAGECASSLPPMPRDSEECKVALNAPQPAAAESNLVSSSSSTEIELDVSLIHRGDCIKVLPGSKVPTDGVVVDGASHADESSLTGESIPVQKLKGDLVYGGTINGQGVLYVQVTKAASENMLASISALVRQAQASKPDAQQFADRVAAVFVPFILVLSTVIFFIWLGVALGGHIELPSDMSPLTFALQFALSTLVVSCPCAIGLAVPTAIMVATGVAAKHGILFKGGPELEMTHRINAIVFDKTGTLTQGKPSVTEAVLLPITSKRATKPLPLPSNWTALLSSNGAVTQDGKQLDSGCIGDLQCCALASASPSPAPFCEDNICSKQTLSMAAPACSAALPDGDEHVATRAACCDRVASNLSSCGTIKPTPTNCCSSTAAVCTKPCGVQSDNVPSAFCSIVARDEAEDDIYATEETEPDASAPLTEADFWLLVGSAELGSEHPIGCSIVVHARHVLGQDVSLQQSNNFLSVPGGGVRCTVAGRVVAVGNLDFLKEQRTEPTVSECGSGGTGCCPLKETAIEPGCCSASELPPISACGASRTAKTVSCSASAQLPCCPMEAPKRATPPAVSCCSSPAAASACTGDKVSVAIACGAPKQVVQACCASAKPYSGSEISVDSKRKPCASTRKACGTSNQLELDNVRDSSFIVSDAIASRACELESSGHTVVHVSIDGQFAGLIGVSDAPRAESIWVVQALSAMGIEVWMMSGDQPRTAKAVAQTLGIHPERVLGGLLPADKAQQVATLQKRGKIVAMVGDGVNDAPALAQANVGIGMASGTDVAMESAHVVLVKSHLQDVLTAIDLSRTTFSRIRLNFAWAMMYNVVGITLAAGTFYAVGRVTIPPAFAGLSELLSSLPVVLFSLLLSSYKLPALSGAGGLS
jgi:cation transport ATPase